MSNEWETPDSQLELLLWRLYAGLPERQQCIEFNHAKIWTYLPSEIHHRVLLKLVGEFQDVRFTARLFVTEKRPQVLCFEVKNQHALNRWLMFERLRSENVVPEFKKFGQGQAYQLNHRIDLEFLPFGLPASNPDTERFLDWSNDHLDQSFIDFTLDFETSDYGVDLVCGFLISNLECSRLAAKRRKFMTFTKAARKLVFTTPDIVLALNTLLFSELKRREETTLVAGSADDKNICTRRADDLTDVCITKNQDRLIEYIRTKMAECREVVAARLDWSPVFPPIFLLDNDQDAPVGDIHTFCPKLFAPEILTKSGSVAA